MADVKRDTPTDKVYEKVDREIPENPDYIETLRTRDIIPTFNPEFAAIIERKRMEDEFEGLS